MTGSSPHKNTIGFGRLRLTLNQNADVSLVFINTETKF